MRIFLLPPITVLLAWITTVFAATAGRRVFLVVHFPLEVTLCASLLACVYVTVRLWSRRSEPQARTVLVLNAAGIALFFAFMLIIGFVGHPNI